jgi:hypothetical protein
MDSGIRRGDGFFEIFAFFNTLLKTPRSDIYRIARALVLQFIAGYDRAGRLPVGAAAWCKPVPGPTSDLECVFFDAGMCVNDWIPADPAPA